MKWIGITGGLGSGKSTVAQRLRELGYKVADADQLARAALEESPDLAARVIARYGPSVQAPGGGIDRKALGKIVFNSKEELSWLEAQIHPVVRDGVEQLKERWSGEGRGIAFYDVPLLYEKKMEDQFDAVVLVAAPTEEIFRRVNARDRLDDTSIFERMSNQIPLHKKRERAHYVLENNRDLPHLFKQVDGLIAQLRS